MTAPRFASLSGAHGELILSNREQSNESRFWLTGLDGYFGGVGVNASPVNRSMGHGVFDARAFRAGRVLTLRGHFKFPDDETRLIADRFLSGVLWDGEYGVLEVTTGDLVLHTRVRLDGEIRHQYVVNTRCLEVEIPLFAPDPFLYAPARQYQIFPAGAGEGLRYPLFSNTRTPGNLDWGADTPASGAASNQGNATAYPVFTVHGSWPAGFRISYGGKAIEYPSPVDASYPVRVDNRTGEVMVAGVDQTHRLTRREWLEVPAGSAIQPQITALAPSTGWCDVTISDTYI